MLKKISLKFLALISALLVCWQTGANNTTKEDSLIAVLNNSSLKADRYQIFLQLVKHTTAYDHKKSIFYATQGELLARNNDDIKWLAEFQIQKGGVYYYLSSYDKALDNYLSSTRNFKSLNDNVNLIRCYNNTGLIYDRIEEYEKAIEYYQLAADHYNELNDTTQNKYARYLPQHYNNIASAYNKLKQKDKALEYYNMALDEATKINFRHILGAIYNNLGIIEIENKNYPAARLYLDKAIKIRLEDNESIGISQSYNVLSQYFFNTNQLDSSLWAAQQSLSISKKADLLELQKASYNLFSMIFERKGLYKRALNEHKAFKLLSDSISNEHKINRIGQLEITHELEQIEEANKIEKIKLEYQNTILILALAVIVLVFVLLVRLYKVQKNKLNKENTKLKLNVDTKNRELTTNVMQRVQNHQIITDIVKELYSLKKDIGSKHKDQLQKIIVNLQSRSNKEIWQEFELRFNQVHTDFFGNIKKRHSDITTSEKRLCALLRLNMTSKEIAAITNQTIRGVEVARSRLRKRLDLTGKDVSLASYLESF